METLEIRKWINLILEFENNEIKYWEGSRDGIHPSSHWHFHLANIFFNGVNFDK